MIDVNKITSTLAKLPDAQLQQYAQMHKSDPYIMALAMSESNRRKELRAASQAPEQPEQPKVVDQMVAEMAPQQLPEDQGIGQLDAGNMDFAGGGIIAFADGGDVERYAGQFGSLTGEFSGFGDLSPEQEAALEINAERDRRSKQLSDLERKVVFLTNAGAPQAQQAQAQLDALKAGDRQPPTPASPSLSGTPSPRATEADAPPGIKAVRQTPAPSSGRVSGSGGLSSIDALQQKYFGDFESRKGDLKDMREGLVQGIKDLTASNLADTQAEIAARGDVYKGREARLAKQEKDIEGMGDKYLGLALLQAGAAMMSTPGGLAAAIGKGAVVGADRYASGLEKINAAQSKFAEARDRLDELRLNRDDMNAKEVRLAKREAKAADLKGQELMLSGFEKDWGVERSMLDTLFTAAKEDLRTDKQIAAQRDIAAAKGGKDRIIDQVFNKLLEDNGNDPVKAQSAFNKLMAKDEDLQALLKREQLKALAEAQVAAAKTGNVLPGQKEALAAMQRDILGGGGSFTVTAGGRAYNFPTKEAADKFKAEAGVK